MAERGLSMPISRATQGRPDITMIASVTPVAMDSAITVESASTRASGSVSFPDRPLSCRGRYARGWRNSNPVYETVNGTGFKIPNWGLCKVRYTDWSTRMGDWRGERQARDARIAAGRAHADGKVVPAA